MEAVFVGLEHGIYEGSISGRQLISDSAWSMTVRATPVFPSVFDPLSIRGSVISFRSTGG